MCLHPVTGSAHLSLCDFPKLVINSVSPGSVKTDLTGHVLPMVVETAVRSLDLLGATAET